MTSVVDCFLYLIMLCLFAGLNMSAGERNLEIIAHRGASYDAPENTLSAFRLAWKQGADGVEGDFHLTKDGEIVCIHDSTTKRTGKKNMVVKNSTLAELKALDVGSWKGSQWKDERIPTLAEVMATVPAGKKILIEIKCGPEVLPALKKILDKTSLKPEQTVIIAFNAEVIARSKRLFPKCKAFWLTGFKKDKKTGHVKPGLSDIMATLKRIRADGLDCNAHSRVDKQFVGMLRKHGMAFHAWTVDKVTTALRFKELGVESLTTNRPGWLRAKLKIK